MTSRIEYDALDTHLKDIGLQVSAAEAHGLITGLVCGNFEKSLALMNSELLEESASDDPRFRDCKAELTQLHAQVADDLKDTQLGFELYLTPESAGTSKRAMALVQWCQGFMYGFGVSAKESERKLSSDAQEALEDIGEFTRLDTLAVSEDDEDEMEALTELEEYMRIAVMTIYQDMLPK